VPAGIDYDEIRELLQKQKKMDKRLIKKDFGFDFEYLAIGVERSDYTKGLIERMKIIDRFLELYPEYQGKFVYLSICPLSRNKIPAYRSFIREFNDLVDKINWKYSTYDWQPIHVVNKSFPREKIFSYYNLSDVCLVTALDDGMNLVAKEYAIACKPQKGMLVLSKFTGAAKDLKSAVLINPYDISNSARALHEALTMSPDEKFKRNNEMKEVLRENNIYRWGMEFIKNTIA
jgi:trehalose 6-phosphate synthase